MKKVLFPILGLILVLGLVMPMATPAAATINTQVIVPTWEVTNNSMVNPTIASALPWTDSAWGGWNPAAWPGPSTGIWGHTISYWVAGDTWMDWLHSGSGSVDFTHRWFHTTVNIPSGWIVTAVNLVYKYNENILPINDDLYVYVDGTLAASGGTASVVGLPGLPSGFVTASGIDWSVAPETGWRLDGGLSLPVSLFTTGNHEIHVLAEEFDTSGGLGHMVFKVTYGVPEIAKVLVESEPVLTPDTNGNGIDEVPIATQQAFTMDITVTNNTGADLTNVVVHDRLGGELFLDSATTATTGTIDTWTRGKTAKWFIDWTIASLPDGQSATLTIEASLDENPGGHQEYSSPGVYDLNSGATIVSAETEVGVFKIGIKTDPISVECAYLVGNWLLSYVQLPPGGGTYNHDMSITTENQHGSFSGTGAYADPPPAYTWVVTGTVTDGTVSMTITYDQIVGGTDPYTVSLTGTVLADGSMTGTATDNKNNSYTWTATRVP